MYRVALARAAASNSNSAVEEVHDTYISMGRTSVRIFLDDSSRHQIYSLTSNTQVQYKEKDNGKN